MSDENNNQFVKTSCKHIFHKECIDEWLKEKENCPLCELLLKINYYVEKAFPVRLQPINLENSIEILDPNNFLNAVKTKIFKIVKEYLKVHHDNIYNVPQVNKRVVGKMKDECNGKIMEVFGGLRAKMYAYKNSNVKFVKKLFF
ncbi:uncharacterized protein LOC126118516 [Schistocerca cancellata]|uniref:uncharacterized protein LOC126118516 n=1 Tax=Schistocerca cancellata TaxID=274614 RepID=UPI002118BE4A|nr:uncharacterized protein LOC126118516 [Schistocerca cancellata]